MTEIFSQALQTWNERIRSPILGSVVIAFVLFNWKPLYFLLFANVPVVTRFDFFEVNSNWITLTVGPVSVGVLLAILTPWASLASAWIAQFPKKRIHYLQDLAATERRIAELDLKEREEDKKRAIASKRERALIEDAERSKEAQVVGGEELRKEVESQRISSKEELRAPIRSDVSANGLEIEIFEELSEHAQDVLRIMSDSPSGQIDVSEYPNSGFPSKYEIDGRILASEKEGRKLERYREGLAELETWKLVTRSYHSYNLATKGDAVYQVVWDRQDQSKRGVKSKSLD